MVATEDDDKKAKDLIRASIGMGASSARADRKQEAKYKKAARRRAFTAYRKAYGIGPLEWLTVMYYVWKLFELVWREMVDDE